MLQMPKVLVVDDSTTASLFMVRALENAGYYVMTAMNGRDGLIKVLQQRPHCLILDVVLPGASGFEVCRQLRVWDPQHRIPIILVSTKDTSADRNWGLRQGADRYLPKPFTEEILVHTVKEMLLEHVYPPVAPHQRAVPHPPGQQPQLALHTVIPHHSKDTDVMMSSNMRAAIIADKQARLLYAAIDGRTTVGELCTIMHLDIDDVSRALQILLAQHHIQLYQPGGQFVDGSLFFNSL